MHFSNSVISAASLAPNLHAPRIPFGIHRAACRGVLLRVAARGAAARCPWCPRRRATCPPPCPTPSLIGVRCSCAQWTTCAVHSTAGDNAASSRPAHRVGRVPATRGYSPRLVEAAPAASWLIGAVYCHAAMLPADVTPGHALVPEVSGRAQMLFPCPCSPPGVHFQRIWRKSVPSAPCASAEAR